MTSPRLAGPTDHGRMYGRTRGGTLEVPSITTVLDVLNQHMEWWESRCAIGSAFDYADNVARIAALPNGPERWGKERKAKTWLEGSATRDRDEAAARGDLVHDYAEAYSLLSIGKTTQADVDDHRAKCKEGGALAYLDHLHRFFDDWQPTVVMPEATVWNETVGYAGTTDLLFQVEIGGEMVSVVGDWKTKRALFKRNGERKDSDLRDYTGMQLAAAAFAEEIWVPGEAEDGSGDFWAPMTFRAEVGVGIAIAPDGYVVRQYAIRHPRMFGSFKALREAWEFYSFGGKLMSGRLDGPGDLRLPNRQSVSAVA